MSGKRSQIPAAYPEVESPVERPSRKLQRKGGRRQSKAPSRTGTGRTTYRSGPSRTTRSNQSVTKRDIEKRGAVGKAARRHRADHDAVGHLNAQCDVRRSKGLPCCDP